MKGALERQFKNSDKKQIVRTRPELKYIPRGITFSEAGNYWSLTVKNKLFFKLDAALENLPDIFKRSNEKIIKDIRQFTNGEFWKTNLDDVLFSDYIDEWKKINL